MRDAERQGACTRGEGLTAQIEGLYRRVEALRERAGRASATDLLDEALEEISAALEELRVAGEELRQQADELDHSGEAVEVERRRYLDLFESAPEGYLVTDARGTVTEANRAAAVRLGVQREHLLGKPLAVFVAIEARRAFRARLALLEGDGTDRIEDWEVPLRLPGGRTMEASLTVAATREARGRLLGLRWLVSDMKGARAALRESEARTRAIVEAAVEAIVTIDDRGVIESFNPAAERLFGYAAGEVVGRSVKTLASGPLRDRSDESVARLLGTHAGEIVGRSREVVGRRKDGALLPIELSVSEVRLGTRRIFAGVMRDVSERKRAERRLAVRHAVTSVLAEAGETADLAPRLLPALAEAGGWDAAELWLADRGAGVLRRSGLWGAPGRGPAASPVLAGAASVARGEGLAGRVWASGRAEWMSAAAEGYGFARAEAAAATGCRDALALPIRTGGTVTGVVTLLGREASRPDHELLEALEGLGGQIGDYLARADAEERLRRLNEELERRVAERTARLEQQIAERERVEARLRTSERLASIGTLAAGVAHEINNPIAGILATAELASASLGEPGASGRLARLLEHMVAEAQRCGRIVKSVLQFARAEPTERWPHDLNDVARRVGDIARAAVEAAGADLRLALAPVLPAVPMNPTEIEQVTINLVRNAVQAGARRVEIRTDARDGRVRLRVADDGRGIPEADAPRIFEPFFTSRREEGGTGLGLSVVHGIVAAHGGTVGVESRPGEGTVVSVELPVRGAPPAPRVDTGRS
jgi:PAS domain S-box-containing protein